LRTWLDWKVGSWFHQVNMLKERNQTYGTIAFVNIGTDDYSPEQNNGIDYETVSHPTLTMRRYLTQLCGFVWWGVSCSVREMNEVVIMAIVGANLKSCVLSRQWGASMLFVEMELCLPMLLYAPLLFSHLVLCESMCWVGFRCRESRQSQGKTEDLNQGLDCAKADEKQFEPFAYCSQHILYFPCVIRPQVRVLSGVTSFFMATMWHLSL
jgi:hypothetical protein